MSKIIFFRIIFLFALSVLIYGCVASPRHPKYETEEYPDSTVSQDNEPDITDEVNPVTSSIIKTALSEQQNEMYSPRYDDSTKLYWLKNKSILLRNQTKCNIFALNTLYKAGYKTPKTNALCRDLYNDELFEDIFSIINIKNEEEIETGDLIVWKTHVIIFEELVYINKMPYAKAVWAGTNKRDNGKNIINNVMYGNYPLKGNYIVRRPQRK